MVALPGCFGWDDPMRRQDPRSLRSTGNVTVVYDRDSPHQRIPVPFPLDALLPTQITIHPYTGMRTFDENDRPVGFEVRIKALDRYDDPTKAFGEFLFILYAYRPQSENPRGARLGLWREQLMDPNKNQLHWDPITQSYKFNLSHRGRLLTGHRYVLEVYFTSPFTERLTTKRVFAADQ